MGCIQSSSTEELTDQRNYPRQVTLNIAVPNSKARNKVKVLLTSPSLVEAQTVVLGDLSIGLSCCVLPGLDPREEIVKECQDGVFFVSAEGQLLVGLFDGHGKEGRKIVELCCRLLKGYFLAHLREFGSDPERAVEHALHQCDLQVKKETECSVSGS